MNVERFSLPLDRPLETAAGVIDAREGFLVTVDLAGERGLGEATPLPGWTESLEECRRALAAVDAPEAALESDGAATEESPPLADRPAARHAVALAVADARARSADEPLYRHLGGPDRVESVPANATVGDGSPEATAEAVASAAAGGFPAVKVKVGARPVSVDVDRLRAARDRIGHRSGARRGADTDPELRADANGAWSPEQAREALPALSDLDVSFVEQPLAVDDLEGHRDLRDYRDRSNGTGTDRRDPSNGTGTDRGSVGVALDESLAAHGVDAVLDARAADVVVCKPMVLGGPDRARRAALRARDAGLEAVVTTTVDGAVARAGAVHVAASLPADRYPADSHPVDRPPAVTYRSGPAHGLATAERLGADLVEDPAPVDDGRVHVPQGPGNLGRRDERGTG